MYRSEVRRKITTFLDDYKVRRDTIGRIGDVESTVFDFAEDLVVVKGTEGSIRFSLSYLEQLATQSIVH